MESVVYDIGRAHIRRELYETDRYSRVFTAMLYVTRQTIDKKKRMRVRTTRRSVDNRFPQALF